ncbi:hypothetical protein K431DRAFT_314437 [Polychaeton citri CBS 116435]|uniref:Uncharacterized protein n=1 Tax=Polychaeton citri CBS 116435 TaxID=1314669 RepID=A0A9P4UN57_9PEZI|nr:hypothetical protein K431DRAFT_314437 [Polychaeton citri CBS 116435]
MSESDTPTDLEHNHDTQADIDFDHLFGNNEDNNVDPAILGIGSQFLQRQDRPTEAAVRQTYLSFQGFPGTNQENIPNLNTVRGYIGPRVPSTSPAHRTPNQTLPYSHVMQPYLQPAWNYGSHQDLASTAAQTWNAAPLQITEGQNVANVSETAQISIHPSATQPTTLGNRTVAATQSNYSPMFSNLGNNPLRSTQQSLQLNSQGLGTHVSMQDMGYGVPPLATHIRNVPGASISSQRSLYAQQIPPVHMPTRYDSGMLHQNVGNWRQPPTQRVKGNRQIPPAPLQQMSSDTRGLQPVTPGAPRLQPGNQTDERQFLQTVQHPNTFSIYHNPYMRAQDGTSFSSVQSQQQPSISNSKPINYTPPNPTGRPRIQPQMNSLAASPAADMSSQDEEHPMSKRRGMKRGEVLPPCKGLEGKTCNKRNWRGGLDPTLEHCDDCYRRLRRDNATPPRFHSSADLATRELAMSDLYPFAPGLKESIPDDDIPVPYSDELESHYVASLMEAINTPYTAGHPEFHDYLLSQQNKFNLKPFDDEEWYNDEEVTGHLRILFNCLYNYHKGGACYLLPRDGANSGYSFDKKARFSDRLAKIHDLLRENKNVAMSVIEGRGILALIWNPAEYGNRKLENAKTNAKKRNRMARTQTPDDQGQQKQQQEAGPSSGRRPRRRKSKRRATGPSSLSARAGSDGASASGPGSSQSASPRRKPSQTARERLQQEQAADGCERQGKGEAGEIRGEEAGFPVRPNATARFQSEEPFQFGLESAHDSDFADEGQEVDWVTDEE